MATNWGGPKQQQITKNNRFEKQQISKISHFRKQHISETTTNEKTDNFEKQVRIFFNFLEFVVVIVICCLF